MNLPNKLTLLRILLTPVFVLCFYIDIPYPMIIAAIVFILAFLTDILDGYLARKQNIVTTFGKLADPIADKFLVVSALVMLVGRDMLSPIIAIIIIARELAVSGLRSVAAAEGSVMAANLLGKLKTISQAIAISLLLMDNPIFSLIGVPMDQIFVWIAFVMTILSGVVYFVQNADSIKMK